MKMSWARRSLLTLSAAGLASACTSTPPADDWVAQKTHEISQANPGYPRLSDVPPYPDNIRTAEQWDAAIAHLEVISADLAAFAEEKRRQLAEDRANP